jgi:putative FmdB family regulatory protein
MAVYEYMCEKCMKVTCDFHSITEDIKTIECRHCGGKAKKIMSANTFHLKGSKWAAKGKEGY